MESDGQTKEKILAAMSAAPLLMNNFTEALDLLIQYIEFMDIKPTNDVDSAKRFIKTLESVQERFKTLVARNKKA
jgi:tetrahydromethanopterin S-methyltransferase subunit A